VNQIVVRGSQCLGVLVLAAVVFQASAQPAPSLPDQRAADLAALDRFVRDSYAFLPMKATDWNAIISAPGDELVAIDGVSVSQLYESRRPRFLTRADPVADEWALASAVGGRHNSRYEFLIRRAGRESLLTPTGTTPARDDVEWKRVRSDIGLIAISTFAPNGVVLAFDRALEALRNTRGLIVDVRSNAGGDTAIARPSSGD
jgi:hypothetical protein